MNREVEIAREVQERLFPQAPPPVTGLDYCGAARVLSSIMQAADSFAAGAKQFDDMTLVVLRVLKPKNR